MDAQLGAFRAEVTGGLAKVSAETAAKEEALKSGAEAIKACLFV